MTTITFDGATLRNPAPLSPSEDKDNFEITIECYTDDYEDVLEMVSRAGQASVQTLLSGKKKLQTTGTLGDLVIDGLDESIDGTYSNCAIVGGVKVEESAGTGERSGNTRLNSSRRNVQMQDPHGIRPHYRDKHP